MRAFRPVSVLLALLALAGCIQPFRLDVRQGNVVTQEMVRLLEPGMTRSQVRFVLGTPLITDSSVDPEKPFNRTDSRPHGTPAM